VQSRYNQLNIALGVYLQVGLYNYKKKTAPKALKSKNTQKQVMELINWKIKIFYAIGKIL